MRGHTPEVASDSLLCTVAKGKDGSGRSVSVRALFGCRIENTGIRKTQNKIEMHMVNRGMKNV
jgi:hypothetical protein